MLMFPADMKEICHFLCNIDCSFLGGTIDSLRRLPGLLFGPIPLRGSLGAALLFTGMLLGDYVYLLVYIVG